MRTKRVYGRGLQARLQHLRRTVDSISSMLTGTYFWPTSAGCERLQWVDCYRLKSPTGSIAASRERFDKGRLIASVLPPKAKGPAYDYSEECAYLLPFLPALFRGDVSIAPLFLQGKGGTERY